MEQTRELWETPATPDGPAGDLGLGCRLGKERELLEWDFDAYVSRAGESWVDPLEFLIDDPTFGFGKPLLPLSLIDDRRHGWNRPIFQTEAQLAMIRGAARIVAQTAPMAIGALEALGNYVIGKGFTYEVADKANRQAPAGLSQAVQDVIDEFCDVNDWIGDRERELHNRVRRDGEAFTALYPDKNGIARTRFIEPERVTEPGNATDFEDWLAAEVPLDWVRADRHQRIPQRSNRVVGHGDERPHAFRRRGRRLRMGRQAAVLHRVGPRRPVLGQSVDPASERSQVTAALVKAAIAQDLDAVFLYSWLHSQVQGEGSPYWAPTVYDFRVDPVMANGLPSHAAWFHDLSLRPSATITPSVTGVSGGPSTVTVTPTAGIYGGTVTNAAGQSAYEQYGPYTDPALYSVPAGTKVQVAA